MSIAVCLAASIWMSGCGGGNEPEPETVPLDNGAQATAAFSGEGYAVPTGGAYTIQAPMLPVSTVSADTQTSAPAPAPEYTAAVSGGGTAAPTTSDPPLSPPSSSCDAADVGGWTVPVPSAHTTSLALTDPKQPGSRLYYISSATGSDQTGQIYFWNGTRIVDSTGNTRDANGNEYGSDPTNPSAAVRPFKRWSHVAPRASATSDIGSRGTPGGPRPLFRAGFPDWWMFKRGETFDLAEDLLSFERQFNPSATMVYGSLAVPGGRSVSERQIVGAYGDICVARPRFVHPLIGFIARYHNVADPIFKNVAYLSLHFDGHHRLPGASYPGIMMLQQTAASTDILFEDIWLDAASFAVSGFNGAQVTLRRSLVTDNYQTDGSHVQGVYYQGSPEGRFRIEESILMRNGFARGDPKHMPWPPTGAQIWDMFNRNLYMNGQTNFAVSGLFDSVSMIGASGDQFRPGMRVERNFFYQGYVNVGANGGYPDNSGPNGSVIDNVLQRFVGTGTNDNLGHPGWGFQISAGAYGIEVARNIVTGAQHAASHYGIGFQPLTDCPLDRTTFATRANRVHSNIMDTSGATAAVRVTDGTSSLCSTRPSPGVRENVATDNVLINSKLRELEYVRVGSVVPTTTDTVAARNRLYPDRKSAAAALGWPAPDRTLKSYMLANQVPVTSSDGFPEYFAKATEMRRGKWIAVWTGTSLVNYFRTGFGMSAIR